MHRDLKQEVQKGLQQRTSMVSTPDNYHDRNSLIPEVTPFILPKPARLWGLPWYMNTISSHIYGNNKEWVLFLSKRQIGTQELNSFLFISHSSQNALLLLYFTDFKTHALPSVAVSELVRLTINGASQWLSHGCHHLSAHFGHSCSCCQWSAQGLLMLHVASIVSI